jgi:hypothetical protein
MTAPKLQFIEKINIITKFVIADSIIGTIGKFILLKLKFQCLDPQQQTLLRVECVEWTLLYV